MPADVVFVNGTVGAGKTTVAHAISRQEGDAGGVHALIDLDAVRLLTPSPPGDPFALEVELANLRDLARNYRAAGATRLVLAGVLEDRAARPRYRDALGGAELMVFRLAVRPEVVERRLRDREGEDSESLAWHLRRAPELAAIQAAAGIDDVVLDASDDPPEVVAHRIRVAAGWTADPPSRSSAV